MFVIPAVPLAFQFKAEIGNPRVAFSKRGVSPFWIFTNFSGMLQRDDMAQVQKRDLDGGKIYFWTQSHVVPCSLSLRSLLVPPALAAGKDLILAIRWLLSRR